MHPTPGPAAARREGRVGRPRRLTRPCIPIPALRAAAVSGLVLLIAACGSGGAVEIALLAPTPTPAPTVAATPTPTLVPEPRAVTIGLVGDLMFARDVVTLMQRHGNGYPFERVMPLFADVDLLIGNLEGTFTARGQRLNKYYTFRAPPELAAGLRDAGFDAVSLANNHALDFGPISLDDTRQALDAVGVSYFGAGEDAATAARPLILEAGGLRLAVLGFSAVRSSVFAGISEPGVARASVEAVEAAVAAAEREADFVVVVFHFGREYDPLPTAEQRALAHAAADSGAVLVAGHHAHTLQPWERRGEALIIYGLGNFVFDLDRDDLRTLGEGPFATTVAVVHLSDGGPPRVDFRPAYIDPDENRPRLASESEATRIRTALREMNTE